jgi:hypothetical protein
VLASLRTAFQRELGPVSPNANLNAGIAAAILGCFPSHLIDSTGLLRSLWLMRITSAAEDAQAMIENLLGADSEPLGNRAGRFA